MPPRKRSKREEKILVERLIKELSRDQDSDRVLNVCFAEQLEFIQDRSELKAAVCTRRCGKTTAAAVYLLHEALKTPGVNCLYLSITRGHAKRTLLSGGDDDAALRRLLDQLGIDAEINLTDLSVRLTNGSVIWITGTDASPEESRKLYGQKYRLAIIDEAGSFRQDLRELVYMKLRPAMAQADGTSGTIALMGTPENNRRFFYSVTCDDAENEHRPPGWSVHRWTYEANPFQRDAVRAQVEELKSQYPGVTTNPNNYMYPYYQQMYLGRWVLDRNALVYAYNPEANTVSELPPGNYTYCAGVDFGFVDAATIVTVAYREHDRTLYVVEAYKASYLDKTEFAVEIVRRKERHGIKRFIADHDPATIADIANRFRVHLEPAEKHDKVGFIGMMNSDWLRAHIKIVRNEDTKALTDELERLVWDKRYLIEGVKREDQACDNHCCDALLYVWRALYHYLAKPDNTPVLDEFQRYALRARKAVSAQVKERQRRNRNQRSYT